MPGNPFDKGNYFSVHERFHVKSVSYINANKSAFWVSVSLTHTTFVEWFCWTCVNKSVHSTLYLTRWLMVMPNSEVLVVGYWFKYCQVSYISRTLVGNYIVHSDVVGASPVGAAPTTSSFSTWHLSSMDWAKTTARRDENHLCFGIWCDLY